MTISKKLDKGTILLVDDNQEFVDSTQEILNMVGYRVICAANLAEARQKIKKHKFTHLLLDLMLPDGSGINILDDLSTTQLDNINITIITGHPMVKKVVRTLYGPRVNYLIKPITFKNLKDALEGEFMAQGVDGSEPSIAPQRSILIGESPEIVDLKRTIELVSKTNANIMLLGESGVGKEVVAKLIHQESDASGELVSTNCGALNKDLVTSELFGHEKGAFTGAVDRKVGVFERAHNGTLFLDEITEMPLELQPNFLRALETQTVVRVGGAESILAQCRVISASNRSASELSEKQYLREDLYFRLAVFPIYIPPLRKRQGDIKLLAEHFLAELSADRSDSIKIDKSSLAVLEEYSWPGNVRELRHTIHRALILTEPGSEYLKLPDRIDSPFTTRNRDETSGVMEVGRSLNEVEKDLIYITLKAFQGDKTKTAKVLGISTKTLYNRLNEYEKSDVQ